MIDVRDVLARLQAAALRAGQADPYRSVHKEVRMTSIDVTQPVPDRVVPSFGGRIPTPKGEELRALLEEVAAECRPLAELGTVADYIPALATVPPDRYAIAVSRLDGDEPSVGDADVPLSLQSISKVFALTLAMQKIDNVEELWCRVGREPSGTSFNSLVQLESERGIPRNPLINAGAIVVADHLRTVCEDPRQELLELVTDLAGSEVDVDGDVWASERDHGSRNRAIANLMASFGNLTHPVEEVLDDYFRQCSLRMTPAQLARSMRFLANDGVDPGTGRAVLTPEKSRRVAALLLTCGTYDAAGEFAFEVGIPCKSGVGGAIVGIVPDQLAVCVWSPPLDARSNSLAGTATLTRLAARAGFSVF
jgi:glutaminase